MPFIARPLLRLISLSASTWVLGLAMLAMACRVVLPAGYMPGASGELQWLTLCSGAGQTRVVAIALFNAHNDTGQDDSAAQPLHCVFAAQLAAQALPPHTAWVFAEPSLYGVAWAPGESAVASFTRKIGSPLGARAPPMVV
ncbi:hypothetical protein H0484_09785 [Pusillimonas sp. CC-YST705]|uniref:DUF2946 domain-containing protein n=1 Tax=Mesopusillimonas faecipullorum TaxID=2755040 RepID=A0ABS8CDB8_9BURK|nr:hypothetical protein [Mesopusillimonas faecipullorum]MCB5364036.1 hypothetical protein [Mesopusillimonas faecipullorum]